MIKVSITDFEDNVDSMLEIESSEEDDNYSSSIFLEKKEVYSLIKQLKKIQNNPLWKELK